MGLFYVVPAHLMLSAVCGSLELASRNIIAGSVKLVYSIIYSLFLVRSSYLVFKLSADSNTGVRHRSWLRPVLPR